MPVVGRHVKPPAGAKRGFSAITSPSAGTFPGQPAQRSLSTPGPGQRIDPRDYFTGEQVRKAKEFQRADAKEKLRGRQYATAMQSPTARLASGISTGNADAMTIGLALQGKLGGRYTRRVR